MSERLRIAFVVEGPTDYCMLEEAVAALLEGRDFVAQRLQPEMSKSFQAVRGQHGTGWPGVCRWCLKMASQAGLSFRNNPLFNHYHLLIIQMDADAAEKRYSDDNIDDPFPGHETLPCVEPCPPSSATTDRLRTLILRWLAEPSLPPQVVLCTPSKALETWILVGLFPNSGVLRRENDIECRPNPDTVLQGQPQRRKLVSGNHKNVEKYRELASEFGENWGRVAERCSEAKRFEEEFRSALGAV